jgi:hypothetical protein
MDHAPLRRYLGRVAAAATVGSLLLATPPASAGLDDGMHTLVHEDATGRIRSDDGAFRRGCQHHPYRYRVRPADSDWSLELFLEDRRGREVSSSYEWQGADPARGRGRFGFCSRATRPGRFTVRARLTWDDGEYHAKWLEPRRIRISRR